MMRLLALMVAAVVSLVPAVGQAQSRALAHPIYYQEMGFAMGGYDPVSYFHGATPMPGNAQHSVMWKGVTWLFASSEHQALFEANPRAYAPRFGGYCSYGVSVGYLVSGDPTAFEIREGVLYMLHSPEVQSRWNVNPAHHLEAAQENWPDLLRE